MNVAKPHISSIILANILLFAISYSGLIAQPESGSSDIADANRFLDMSLEELMNVKVVTASRFKETLSNSPAVIFAISEEEILNRGYNSLEDLLDEIPGIEIQRKSRTESSNMFSLQGIYGFNKFQILKDGVQINSMTGSPHSIGRSYSLQNIKQVEVVLGPISSIYGADAFSGVVNIITKRGQKTSDLSLNASYGMFNSLDVSIDKNFFFQDAVLDVIARYYQTDEPFFPDIYEKEYSWYNDHYKQSGEMIKFGDTVSLPIEKFQMPTLSYLLAANLNIQNFNIGFSRNFESQSSSVSNPPEYYLYSKDAVYQNSIETIYADHQYSSKDRKLGLKSQISFQRFRITPKSNYINQYSAYSNGYKYGNHKTLSMDEQAHVSLTESIIMNFGVSFKSSSILPKTSDLPWKFNERRPTESLVIPYVGTDILDMYGNDLTIYQDIYNISCENYGTYIHIIGEIIPSLSYNCGLRYDYNTRYKDNISPRIALMYHPDSKISMKLLLSKAFLSPSPFEAYQHYGSFYPDTDSEGSILGLASSYWRLPNSDLEPEKIHSVEYDFSYNLNGNYHFRFLTFFRYINNLITIEGIPDYEFKGVNVDWVERPVNGGKSEVYGSSVIMRGVESISNSSKLGFSLNYTFIDGSIANGPLIYSAKHTIKAGLNYRYADKINIYLNALFRSASHHRLSNYETELMNDPFYVVNLFTSYKALENKKFTSDIFLKINNLFNLKYYHTGFEGFIRTPQNPITISFGSKIFF